MKGTTILAATAVLITLGAFVFLHDRSEPSKSIDSIARAEATPSHRDYSSFTGTRAASPSPEAVSNAPAVTNLYKRLSGGEIPKLSREQLESFLAKNHRNVDALLGALRASDDPELLKELKEKFPNDPRVQFAAAFKSDSPEERRQWLEKFKESAPDNALANYLLANDRLKAGDTTAAMQEMAAANSKAGFDNYLIDFIQNTEEAYRAGGFSEGEAKLAAGEGALLPELAQLKGTGTDLVDLAKKYQQAGDEASAQTLFQMALNLGHRLDQSPQITLIQDLVGIAIERAVLNAMNPNAPYGNTGQTVQNQIDALNQRRNEYKDLVKQSDPILQNMSDSDIVHYFDRIKLYGGVAAMQWAIKKYPQQQ